MPAMDYSESSREELILRIKSLEADLNNQKCESRILSTSLRQDLDFSKCTARPIALKVAYFGWNYFGSADSKDSKRTISSELLKALVNSRLIPPDKKSCSLSHCGRTDKGVCACSQVFSLWIRSKADPNTEGTLSWEQLMSDPGNYVRKNLLKDGMYETGDRKATNQHTMDEFTTYTNTSELPYLSLINARLPKDIYVLAWTPTSPGFNARFSCVDRSYIYIFPAAQLNISKMREASKKFIGQHDFCNFCKIDPRKPEKSTLRNISECDILALDRIPDAFFGDLKFNQVEEYINDSGFPKSHSQMFLFYTKSRGFLWNQIRRMMYVLLLIGMEIEPVSIVTDMLREKQSRSLPFVHSYNSAAYPLTFINCTYSTNLAWIVLDNPAKGCYKKYLINKVSSLWEEHAIKSIQVNSLISEINKIDISTNDPEKNTKKSKMHALRLKSC